MSNQNDLALIATTIDRLNNNPVSRLAYTQKAYDNDVIDSVETYDYPSEQNIPLSPDMHPKILDKGFRAQGASISRNGVNHFFGRTSFNLNKLIERFKYFLGLNAAVWAHNAFEYDPSAKYRMGDVCYSIEAQDGAKLYTWYYRKSSSPETIQGVFPTSGEHWEAMLESTSLPVPRFLSAGETFNSLRKPGVYIAPTSAIGDSLENGPPQASNLGVCVVTIKGDLAGSVITQQQVLIRSSGDEYTRILQGETVVVDWYKTKPSGGSGGVDGLWALQIEADGHLYVYYGEQDEPPLFIDSNAGSLTYGHLIWEVTA